jgi:hypothetical protein
MSTFTDDTTDDASNTNKELADDTDASLGELTRMVEFEDENAMQTPFGPMTEAELIDMLRPMFADWVRTNPDQAIQLLGVLHLAAGDLLSKHAEQDPEEIVGELGE